VIKKITVEIPELLKEMGGPKFHAVAIKNAAISVQSWMKTEYYPAKNRKEPNKLGGKRTNFWADIGRAVQPPVARGNDAIIKILDPRIAQKVYGGEIKAKRVQYLTIPVSKEAYSIRAATFERETGKKLFVWKSEKNEKFLAESIDGSLKLHYLLKQSVNQKPWPGAIPSEKELAEKFVQGFERHLRSKQIQR
jgi:hypothetical protein